jgi:pullulanase/glycogen debranching enzyme
MLNKPDWSEASKTLAFFLNGTEKAHASHQTAEIIRDNDFFVMFNGDEKALVFELPEVKETRWHLLVDTGKPSPDDIVDEDKAQQVADREYCLGPSAAAVLMAIPFKSEVG